MDSSELYHTKQQFYLGAYTSLTTASLPDSSSDDYTPTLLYTARAHLALNSPSAALALLQQHPDAEEIRVKALKSLTKYVQDPDESTLEELRDLVVEVESEGEEKVKGFVKVVAGIALVRAGEIEEAIDTLGADTQDLEVVLILTQIYLSIARPDQAIKIFTAATKWAEDDTLLQLIESTISLYSPPPSMQKSNTSFTYRNAENFFTEQLANPSLSSPHILKSRGVARILGGEFQAAKSDLEEALEQEQSRNIVDPETKAAYVVATALAGEQQRSDEIFMEFQSAFPAHPLAAEVNAKSAAFDELVKANWTAPKLAVA